MIKYLAILVLFLTCKYAGAQVTSQDKPENIACTKNFLTTYLGLNLGKDFYPLSDSTGKPLDFSSTGMHSYVYASYKNEIKSVFGTNAYKYFGYKDSAAQVYADSLKKCGYDVLLYKTAGTSGAQFNKPMLAYNPGTIAFIILHEGFHRHRQNTKAKLPYVFEEAVCDLTGNMYALLCLTNNVDKKITKRFTKTNEKIYEIINKGIDGKLSKETCTGELKKALKKGDAFQYDRYDYEINNAYFIRYTSYCKYYFTLKKAFLRCKSAADFYNAVVKLEGTEDEVLKGIEKIGQ